MNELDVTWGRTMQVWWAFFWRGIVYVMLPAFFLGAVVGVVLAVNKVPLEPHAWKLQMVGGAMGLFVGIWLTRVILRKTYSGFRIALVAVPEIEAAAQPSAPADVPSEPAALQARD
ncbi:MAG: hypothetical protein VX549_08135 [Pseudomonadota bacterium]|nr:hypothetical protein [Pseudomonadota bacterium]